jgi:gamma-glutamyl:cysteine ligase YbdK (ATP-grasp superfamily)
MVPRNVQLRLDEPGDAELLGSRQAMRAAADDNAWHDASYGLTDLYRTLDDATRRRVLERVRRLREQLKAEAVPP